MRQQLLDQQAVAEEAIHQAQQHQATIPAVLLYCHHVKDTTLPLSPSL